MAELAAELQVKVECARTWIGSGAKISDLFVVEPAVAVDRNRLAVTLT